MFEPEVGAVGEVVIPGLARCGVGVFRDGSGGGIPRERVRWEDGWHGGERGVVG